MNYSEIPLPTPPTDRILADTHASILVPFPSSVDPNDPLRWPTHKKNIAFVSVCAFTFLTNYAISGLAPAFYVLSKQFGKSMTETSQLLLYPVLVLGAYVKYMYELHVRHSLTSYFGI